jgi:hypothetical protein
MWHVAAFILSLVVGGVAGHRMKRWLPEDPCGRD